MIVDIVYAIVKRKEEQDVFPEPVGVCVRTQSYVFQFLIVRYNLRQTYRYGMRFRIFEINGRRTKGSNLKRSVFHSVRDVFAKLHI